MVDLLIQPSCRERRGWRSLLRVPPEGTLLGHPVAAWREKTRRELGLDVERPVIATGHQTLLWHPGILAKYMAVDAVARAENLATANLIVDQHAGGFGAYEAPLRRRDGTLAVRRIELTRVQAEVPMALHDAFVPSTPPTIPGAALPSVADGIRRIDAAVRAHADAPNAAAQMGRAISDLMAPWVRPLVHVTASDLLETSLARALLREMTRDPWRCADAYNRALGAVPEAGINPLLVRDDYVELPLWRLRPDRRRMHAYDNDVERAVEEGLEAPRLMPRALLMTALIRLGMCDLFVHGTGGARYDRAMEHWVEQWLGVTPAPIAVASASVYLPLIDDPDRIPDVARAVDVARRVWHDPESDPSPTSDAHRPGEIKQTLLRAIEQTPPGSLRRREAFFTMHRQLQTLRGAHAGHVERWQRRATDAKQRALDHVIAERRDWPFPLYDSATIDALAAAVETEVRGERAGCSDGGK